MLDIKIPDLKTFEDNAIAAVKQIVADAMDRLENGDVKFAGAIIQQDDQSGKKVTYSFDVTVALGQRAQTRL
jgi:hypothetical protein